MEFVLLYANQISDAIKEVRSIGGIINQKFTPKIFSAMIPNLDVVKSLKFSTDKFPSTISKQESLFIESWLKFRKNKNSKSLLKDEREGLAWNSNGFLPPICLSSSNTPTSLYMTETIAIGIIVVSGSNELRIENDEVKLIVSEVMEALEFLSTSEPRAKLSFEYDLQVVPVTAAPGKTTDYESSESPWRDEALGVMGFSANRQGSLEYVENLRMDRKTKWSYVVFFTKYPLKHFAYADGEKIVMSYYNGRWKPEFINKVFAHETCHIFGAADEYGNCSCTSTHGYLGIPNTNCINCASNQEECLMSNNNLSLCQWTREQIGWNNILFPA